MKLPIRPKILVLRRASFERVPIFSMSASSAFAEEHSENIDRSSSDIDPKNSSRACTKIVVSFPLCSPIEVSIVGKLLRREPKRGIYQQSHEI